MSEENTDNTTEIQKKRASRQIRYMAQYVQLEEQGVSGLSKSVIVIIFAIMVGFIIWSNFMKVDEVAVSFGAVVPKGSVRTVQHLEGGIVRKTYVEERQVVEAGQLLVELDAAQVGAELEQHLVRETILELREERLRASASGRKPDFQKWETTHASMVRDQLEVYESSIDRVNSQIEVLNKQLEEKNEEVKATQEQQKAVKRQLGLIKEEVQMRRQLFEKGHGSKVSFIESKRTQAGMESELSRLVGSEQAALKSIAEIEERISDLGVNERQNMLNELDVATAELNQIREKILQMRDRVKRLKITAPVKGFVKDIKVKSEGGVVAAGGILMDIVPMEDELLVEARISTRDIGHVNQGQPVTVKVTSYDFSRYGSVEGELENISATTYIDEKDGTPYYKATVQLTKPYVGEDPQKNKILPGMTVQADILTGNKTLFQYLLKPIYVSLQQSFRER